MEFLDKKEQFPNKVSLILGFFDGVHLGHREVIKSAVEFAKNNNTKSVLLTFKNSPKEYFSNDKEQIEYIYSREYSYELIKKLGVDYIKEFDFSELVNLSAQDFLDLISEKYQPISVSTGFNYTFGKNKIGNSEFLETGQKKYNYKYFKVPALQCNNKVISSTYIKELLLSGEIDLANDLLGENYTLKGVVVRGAQLGRQLGFPTANIEPNKKYQPLIPYGVYKAKVFDKPAVLNWGIKPTIENNEPLLEVHIPNFEADLYNKILKIEVLQKIRDEKKFNNLEELKIQIQKDTEICLES